MFYSFGSSITDETGLQEEKKKVDNRVLETKRRTIQDAVERVTIDGESDSTSTGAGAGSSAGGDFNIDVVLSNPPGALSSKKKLVQTMSVKFSSPQGSNNNTAATSAALSSPTHSTSSATAAIAAEATPTK